MTLTRTSEEKIEQSRLDTMGLSDAKIRVTLSKNTTPRQRDQAVAKAQALTTFMLQHGIPDKVVQFVLSVQKLVPPDYPIDWKLWLCAPATARPPPLWWRVVMLIVEADAVGGKRYKLQATKCSSLTSADSDVVVDVAGQKRLANLDIWTWDTAVSLQILGTYFFNSKVNEVAKKANDKFRNQMNHYNVDMSFRQGFECIANLLTSLGQKEASAEVVSFHAKVRSWFPAFDVASKMQQSRERPLMLTMKQYQEFKKYVLGPDDNILSTCRLRFQCGASGGKTVMATILCVEFAQSAVAPTDKALFLTHAPILAKRTAHDLRDQLELKLCSSTQISSKQHKNVKMQGPAHNDDHCVFRIFVDGIEKIVVATINAALDSLRGEVFLAGVVVDEAHAVYGANLRTGATIGQCRVHAAEVAPIIEAWGGARGDHDAAKRLVLFGDERNQSVRRRFTDTGNNLEGCEGCGAPRLPCWMAAKFEGSFYSQVERLFYLFDEDGDGKLSQKEFAMFLEKTQVCPDSQTGSPRCKNSTPMWSEG